MKLLRIVFKGVLWILAPLVLCASIGLVVLWFYSPGEAQPVVDINGDEVPGSISTIETVTIGGVEQFLNIRGHNANAPVMLFLHGGPGSPEYPMLRQTGLGLEEDFVMVYWDQRGAGKSFDPDASAADMNLDRFVADTDELSALLRDRFDHEKIYLMGHSWGSLLGLLTVKAHPEHFYAYFGLGQVGHQFRGEQVGLEWARARAEEAGDEDAIQALNALKLPSADADARDWLQYLGIQRAQLDAFGGGVAHEAPGNLRLLGWMLATPEYSMADKLNYARGLLYSGTELWHEVINTDLIAIVDRVEVPVYILQGAWDYQTPTPIARELFDSLDAPYKEWVTFENSAHSPIMEEPEKFNAVVRAAAGLE